MKIPRQSSNKLVPSFRNELIANILSDFQTILEDMYFGNFLRTAKLIAEKTIYLSLG